MENFENNNEVVEVEETVPEINYDDYRYNNDNSMAGKLAGAAGIGALAAIVVYKIGEKFVVPFFKNQKAKAERKKLVEEAKKQIIEEQLKKNAEETKEEKTEK